MSEMKDFIIRTEDVRPDEILDLFVSTERDEELLSKLKSQTPLIIEGSRGTGKSLLLRVCEQRQLSVFDSEHILPIYVSFVKSSLLHTSDPMQFQHWMLARLSARILRALYSYGLLGRSVHAAQVLSGGDVGYVGKETNLEKIVLRYENSYKNPGEDIDGSEIPTLENFRDAIQDLLPRPLQRIPKVL